MSLEISAWRLVQCFMFLKFISNEENNTIFTVTNLWIDDDAAFGHVVDIRDRPHDVVDRRWLAPVLLVLAAAVRVLPGVAHGVGGGRGGRRHGLGHLRLGLVAGTGRAQAPRHRASGGICKEETASGDDFHMEIVLELTIFYELMKPSQNLDPVCFSC